MGNAGRPLEGILVLLPGCLLCLWMLHAVCPGCRMLPDGAHHQQLFLTSYLSFPEGCLGYDFLCICHRQLEKKPSVYSPPGSLQLCFVLFEEWWPFLHQFESPLPVVQGDPWLLLS